MANKDKRFYGAAYEEDEKARIAWEREEKEKFVEGMKKYPDKGIPVYIDDKIPKEQRDWDKLIMVREDRRFYMADFVTDDRGELCQIRFDAVYHKDADSDEEGKRNRGKRRNRKDER